MPMLHLKGGLQTFEYSFFRGSRHLAIADCPYYGSFALKRQLKVHDRRPRRMKQ